MKALPGCLLTIILFNLFLGTAAQQFNAPLHPPTHPINDPPKAKMAKQPDLQINNVRLESTVANPDGSLTVRISITYSNAGAVATGRNFDMALYGIKSSFEGGSTSISTINIALKPNLAPLTANQSRTEEWTFTVGSRSLVAGSTGCILYIDPDNRIEESGEKNNYSNIFTIGTR